ncbi:MAG: helicase HerA domain-containing protein [Candidatus Nitrospinota bacterium M3_3B_026]
MKGIRSLGKSGSGPVFIDTPRLIETRMLIQANSGAGKSWAIRRLLEQTYGQTQHIVIDPEGEYATLREQFDYVICAPSGGDALASPKTASLLARRILELRVSAVIDIYEMKAHERQRFVKLFLESLMNAPRTLWGPVLVVIDEAHVYCPEKGKAESAGAVIDLATRGRKRGFCAALATQRLSKLHKDAAAEMLNKLIGRTGLDVDVKRAADELGLTKERARELRNLKPGEFYAYGPALSLNELAPLTIGPVKTTHPKVGHRGDAAPPAPSAKVKKLLAELKDLPKEAETEARTVTELRAENMKLRRALTVAEKRVERGGVPEREVERRIREAVATVKKEAVSGETRAADSRCSKALQRIIVTAQKALEAQAPRHDQATAPSNGPPTRESRTSNTPPAPASLSACPAQAGVDGLRSGAVRILQELAARRPAGYSRSQVATLTGFSPKGGTFNTYLGDLRRGGFIRDEGKRGLVYVTDEGVLALGKSIKDTPKTHEEVMDLWRRALRKGAYRMLEEVVAAGPAGLSREEIAVRVDMTMTGGTFNTYLGDLRRNGLVKDRDGSVTATGILFPEAV